MPNDIFEQIIPEIPLAVHSHRMFPRICRRQQWVEFGKPEKANSCVFVDLQSLILFSLAIKTTRWKFQR
jgi:hypothetical protein